MRDKLLIIALYAAFLAAAGLCLLACDSKEKTQKYTVDEATSAVEWKGYLKDGNGNNGTIKVTGEVSVSGNNEVVGGEFKLPLSSLININLPADEVKAQLIHHLQSADFFNMAVYPEISFKITSVAPDKTAPGSYLATGDLTFLGKTNPISFPVTITFSQGSIEVTGAVSIDRRLWGMTYATDEQAADGMYVKPGIDLQFKLVAKQAHK